jgi:ElaB/YqjD/DUF883 family membrane-anchored ribosome-binding protein
MNDPRQSPVQKSADDLTNSFRAVVENAEQLLRATANYSAEGFSDVRARFQDQLTEAKAQLANAQAVVTDRAKQAADVTEQYVHENPWKSLAIAVSVGAVVGLLARGR